MLPAFIYYPTELGTPVGPSSLPGYTLISREGRLSLSPEPGETVQGAIYQMPEGEWKQFEDIRDVRPLFWGENICAGTPGGIKEFSKKDLRQFLASLGQNKWKYSQL